MHISPPFRCSPFGDTCQRRQSRPARLLATDDRGHPWVHRVCRRPARTAVQFPEPGQRPERLAPHHPFAAALLGLGAAFLVAPVPATAPFGFRIAALAVPRRSSLRRGAAATPRGGSRHHYSYPEGRLMAHSTATATPRGSSFSPRLASPSPFV